MSNNRYDLPSSLVFLESHAEGYLYQASGKTDRSNFKILLAIPNFSKARVDDLVRHNEEELCRLAYERAVTGHAMSYGTCVNPVQSAKYISKNMLWHLTGD